MSIKRVGVVGGGTIGSGWLRLLRTHGFEVRLFDVDPARCDGARSLQEAVTGADLVIEAVVEREKVKRELLGSVARSAPDSALLASSSSSILPGRLQEALPHPGRFLILHPMHPVELMPPVEIVPGPLTEPGTVAEAEALIRTLGKVPIRLDREITGYVINRLVAALFREAIHLVNEGVINPSALDQAVSRGPCLGWAVQGPFLTYVLAAPGGFGHFMEHLKPAFESIWDTLATWTEFDPSSLARLTSAVGQDYANLSRTDLEQERDRLIQAAIALRAQENDRPMHS